MKQKITGFWKITNEKWINLFKVQYINSKNKLCEWIFASREENPFEGIK